jgi:hypothetical protein
MRKAIVVLLAGLVLVVAFAAPAFALRDPFDPVVDLTPDTADGGGGGGASEEGATTNADVGADVNQAVTQAETLANTGSEVEPWLVVAYGLIAVGAGAVVLSKTITPARPKR